MDAKSVAEERKPAPLHYGTDTLLSDQSMVNFRSAKYQRFSSREKLVVIADSQGLAFALIIFSRKLMDQAIGLPDCASSLDELRRSAHSNEE